MRYPEPDDVATAVAHTLFAPEPRRCYLVVPNQREAEARMLDEALPR